MRVAIISSGFLPVIDGVTVTLWQRIHYLNQLGHQVLLFCPDYRELESIYPNWQQYTGQILPNVKVINLSSTPFLELDFERNVSFDSYQKLLQELKIFQPDIIHVDEPERLWLGFLKRPGIDFADRNHIPCISFFHTNFIEYLETYLKLPSPILKLLQFLIKFHRNWLYHSYDAVLVSSPSTATKLRKLGMKKIINQTLLGVDINSYQSTFKSATFFEKTYNISNLCNKVKIILLGRLTPEKGWNFILNSLLNSSNKIDFTKIAFIIVGDGFMREEIIRKLSQLTPNVYCLGRLPPDDIPALLINSDIYLTASEYETTGLTILEAQAANLAILAPHSEGIIDSIENNVNGLLFQPGDQKEFIKKLQLLAVNDNLRKRLGNEARKSVQTCTWQQANQNLVEIWKQQILINQNQCGKQGNRNKN